MQEFYTYMWLREDGTPYYVGKGSGKRAYTSQGHIVHSPKEPECIVIYPAESEADAFETEVTLVWYYGRKDLGTGCLRNLTDGGENPPNWKGKKRSEHQRTSLSATKKGVPLSEAHKAALTGVKKSGISFWKGKKRPPLSPECKAKIKITRTGMSISTKGKPWTEARRAAQSTKGQPWTDARRAAQNRRNIL